MIIEWNFSDLGHLDGLDEEEVIKYFTDEHDLKAAYYNNLNETRCSLLYRQILMTQQRTKVTNDLLSAEWLQPKVVN